MSLREDFFYPSVNIKGNLHGKMLVTHLQKRENATSLWQLFLSFDTCGMKLFVDVFKIYKERNSRGLVMTDAKTMT